MERAYKRWVCVFLAVVLALLAICAAVVYIVDPALYYRMPADGKAVYFSERCQSAGMAKHIAADTVLVGTSMTSNYRASRIGEVFGGSGLRLLLQDGYLSEFDQLMEMLLRNQTPERIIFAIDLNIMIRDESGITGAMPEYLYNRSRVDDIRYLLGKDNLYYSVFTLLSRRQGEVESLDEGFAWDEGIAWDHEYALSCYSRPEPSGEVLPMDAYLTNVRSNLEVMGRWFDENPEIQFSLFLSPYSMLFWDKAVRMGETDALLAAAEEICSTLLEYDNVHLYGYLMDREFVEDLDNYCDHIHHSPAMGDRLLLKIAAGEGRLAEENVSAAIANWREFVVNYDYEKFWDATSWQNRAAARADGAAS